MDANGTTNGTTNGTVMDGNGRMDGKKRARLIERGRNIISNAPYEVWDVGCGFDVCVVYLVLDTGEPETLAFPYDRIEHLTGTGVLGCWSGDATGGKAIRELGYEPIEED